MTRKKDSAHQPAKWAAVVFDAYGTLFDVHSVASAAEQMFPGQGEPLSRLWRTKQLEYSWIRAMSGRYKPFWDITRDALAEAIAELAERYGDDPTDWRWGDAHVAVFPHQVVSLMPLVGSFFTNSVEADGGNFTLNRGATPIVSAERAFQDVHGAGYRAVYDLADLGRSQFMIATGQSGNPLSPYFDDLIEPWRDGQWLTLGAPPEELQQTSIGTLTLRPES